MGNIDKRLKMNRRLNLKNTCEIKPLNFDERNQKLWI